jgi:hypothetical protein
VIQLCSISSAVSVGNMQFLEELSRGLCRAIAVRQEAHEQRQPVAHKHYWELVKGCVGVGERTSS